MMSEAEILRQKTRPLSYMAQSAIRCAIGSGLLQPASEHPFCVDCGAAPKCYDHRDYTKPFSVEPVCVRCNRRRGAAAPYKGMPSISGEKTPTFRGEHVLRAYLRLRAAFYPDVRWVSEDAPCEPVLSADQINLLLSPQAPKAGPHCPMAWKQDIQRLVSGAAENNYLICRSLALRNHRHRPNTCCVGVAPDGVTQQAVPQETQPSDRDRR